MQVSTNEYSVFLVMGESNVQRIKEWDPAVFSPLKLGHPWNSMKLRDVVIMYASPGEIELLDQVKSLEQLKDYLRLLSRGFKFRPDLGDNDAPYFGKNIAGN